MLADAAKTLADAAQGTANTANTNAGTAMTNAGLALTAAGLAKTAADNATIALTNIASDSILSPSEKPSVIQDRDVIVAEQAGIDGQAVATGFTAPCAAAKTAYDNAVAALVAYLATLTAPTLWSNVAGDTNIIGTNFRAAFTLVYTARQALLNKIAATAATLAWWAGIPDVAVTTPQMTGESVVLFRVYSSVVAVSVTTASIPTTASPTDFYFPIASLTYTTYGYGSRKIDFVGFAGTWTSSPVTLNAYAELILRRNVGGVLKTLWAAGQSTKSFIGTWGPGAGPGQGVPGDIAKSVLSFDTDAIGSPGVATSVTYELVIHMNLNSSGACTATFIAPAVGYAGQRSITVMEYQR